MEKELEIYGMKFLVTGSKGFVGKHLVDRLRAEGHETYGLSRYDSDDIFDIYCNINNIGDVEWVFSNYNFDGVFNLAGLTHPPTSFKDPQKYFETNALGTINIVEAIKRNLPSCVLMQCSTPEVYGICPDVEITEDFPLRPMNPYGVSKAAADLYILEQTRNNALNGFITRAGSHTGPGRPSNYSISSDAIQIAKILAGKQVPIIKVGNLKSVRAVMDVRDVCNAYLKLMLAFIGKKIPNGEVFHISKKEGHEIGYYLDLMLNLFSVSAITEIDPNLYRPIDIPIQVLNSNKISKYTNWYQEIEIEQTLTDLINYWKEKV